MSFNEQVERLPLGQSIDVFEDVRGSADINDITSRAIDSSFRRHDKDGSMPGYSRSVFWLRLDLDYRPVASSDPRTWLLELAYPPLDKLDLYLPDGQGVTASPSAPSGRLPFASRPIRQNNYRFELGLGAEQAAACLPALESQGSIQAPLTLWSPKAYLEERPNASMCSACIYGVLLVMLIYNLFIFLSVRDTKAISTTSSISLRLGLYQVSVNGAGIEYFWPDSPWWANAATPFLIGSGGAVRLPVLRQLPAYPRPQRVGRPRPAGADGGRRAGHAMVADHELRRGPAPGHLPGAGLHRPDLRRRHPRLAARHARGALFHHRLDRLPSRRHRQHP
ncbi:7TMR-DISM family protein [Pseudomonas aeruginosa]